MRLRTILIVIAALLGTLVLALVVFLATFDANQYKSVIEAKAREATGRELSIKGPISLALSLHPTLVVEDVSLANMAGGARPEMLTAKRLEVALDALPFITSRQISIDRVKLAGVDLLLETDRSGRGNWQFAAAQASAAPGAAPGSAAPPAARGPAPTLRDIEVIDTTVTYRDGATGKERKLVLGRLMLEPGGASIPVQAAGALDAVPFEIKGSVGSGALVGAAEFPVTLAGRLLGFDIAIDGIVGKLFQAKISAGDLKPLATALGSELPALGGVSINATVAGPLTAPVLKPLALVIGDNELQGEASLRLGGARPVLTAHLMSKRLVLGGGAGKTPPARAAGAPAAPAAKAPLFSPAPLPFDALAAADLNLRLEVSSLLFGDLALDGVSATITLANGLLTAKPVALGIAGGHVTLDATLDAGRKAISIDAVAHEIATDLLLKQLGLSPYVAAKADLAAKLAGHGDSAHAIAASLGGTTHLTLGSGQIAGQLIQSGLGEAVKLIAPGRGNTARLTCAVTHLDFANGVGTLRPLVVDTADVAVNGTGTLDLGRETVDIRMVPRVHDATLGRFALPFLLRGPLTAPSVQADAAGIAETAAAAAGSGALRQLGGQLGGILGSGAARPSGAPATGCGAPAAAPAAANPAPAAPAPAAPANQLPGILNNLGRSLGR